MMTVVIRVAEDGCIRSVRANGHAEGGPPGTNVACGAATTLLRAAAEVLGSEEMLHCAVEAPEPGEMTLNLHPVAGPVRDWVRGITEFLLHGCLLVEQEFPKAVTVRIDRERERNGT